MSEVCSFAAAPTRAARPDTPIPEQTMPLSEDLIRFYTQLGLDEVRLRQFGAELDGVVHPAPATALSRFRPNAPGRSSVLNQGAARPPLPRAAGPGPAPRTAERELLRRAVLRDQAGRAEPGFWTEVNRLRGRQQLLLKHEEALLRAEMSLRNRGVAAGGPASGAGSGGDEFHPAGTSGHSAWEAKVRQDQERPVAWDRALDAWQQRLEAWHAAIGDTEVQIATLGTEEAELRQGAATLRERAEALRAARRDPDTLGIAPFPGEERFLAVAAGPSAWEADVRAGATSLAAWNGALSAWDAHQTRWQEALLDASSRTIGDLIAREASLRQAAAGLRDREQDLRDRGVDDEEMSLEPFPGEERFLPPSAWEAAVRTGRASLSAWRDALSAWDERQDEWDQALVEIEVEFEDD
jgi:hypothetical protein